MTRDRKLVACCAVLAVLGALAGCDRSADVVRARRFEVVDAAGVVRADLAVTSAAPRLWLYDAAGKRRARVGMGADGSPGLWLSDATGRLRGVLGVDPYGSPVLALYDAAGKARAGLGVLADGSPRLGLSDAAGKRCRVVSCR